MDGSGNVESRTVGIVAKVRRLGSGIVRSLSTDTARPNQRDIKPQLLAERWSQGPLDGDLWTHPFTPSDVMRGLLDYQEPFSLTEMVDAMDPGARRQQADLQSEFQVEYFRTLRSLMELADAGVIDSVEVGEDEKPGQEKMFVVSDKQKVVDFLKK